MNLEKELIKQNKKENLGETLLLKQLDKVSDSTDPLERIGIKTIRNAKNLKQNLNIEKEKISKFNRERVFHISQIEALCHKYHLRMLPSELYRGDLDNDIISAIQAYEIGYDEKMDSKSSFIVAPKESFELQEEPVDPLLFHKVSDNYFYLVHKWGNDLSFLRSLIRFRAISFYTSLIVIGCICFFKLFTTILSVPVGLSLIFISVFSFGSVVFFLSEGFLFYNKSKWQSRHE